MAIRSWLVRPYAQLVAAHVKHWSGNAVNEQEKIFGHLLSKAQETIFGKENGFASIKNYEEYKAKVPLREYEQFKPWIEQIKQGGKNVLWPGRPKYLAKTSGTTSGIKYIPITNDSIGNHFYSAQTALMLFMAETGKYNIMDRKMIFLSGSPVFEKTGNIPTGRLSGIVNHEIPAYLKGNQLPKWETNCIEDWDMKLERITNETINRDISLISGIPPWIQMYFDKLTEKKGKPVKDIFPNFEVLVYGGVNFEPYRNKMMQSIGKKIATVETYPASEGFFAYQDSQQHEGLLLNAASGIFFEFVPVSEIFSEHPSRHSLGEVEMGVNYALIVNSNAGLWGYNTGDTVKFISAKPYRLIVTGRIKHFISAFGEHVIGEEVESAMAAVAMHFNTSVIEFTVAPRINIAGELPYHEWLTEFADLPKDIAAFAEELDKKMCEKNIYYRDLIKGKILQPLKISVLKKNAFIDYMRVQGKLGGQNKLPRLSNDRVIADALQPFIIGGV